MGLSLSDNGTTSPGYVWKPEPSSRGTSAILSSCLITLSLCLWKVLHLNLPRYEEKFWEEKKRKTLWLELGLIAPELVR